MNINYREKHIPQDTKFADRDFVDFDFTKTDMTGVVFKNVNFFNCIFDKTICKGTRFWCCFFDNCTFNRIDLNNTYLGAWGGGQSNCKFIKCKLGKSITVSYMTNITFDTCKIKDVEIRGYYLDNIKFIGLIDGFIIRKFITKEIGQYQTPERTKIVEQLIKEKIGKVFDNPKAVLKNIDFSEARLQFLDFSECELTDITVPNDDKHLLIYDHLQIVAKKVYDDVEQNWDNEETKSWALFCTQKFLDLPTGIVCYYDFKHYENETFADKLMALFLKYNFH